MIFAGFSFKRALAGLVLGAALMFGASHVTYAQGGRRHDERREYRDHYRLDRRYYGDRYRNERRRYFNDRYYYGPRYRGYYGPGWGWPRPYPYGWYFRP
jgi:hypothetical protein